MRLYLVRHGQTSWNKERRAQGHTDTELDETGRSQARSLVEPFSALDVEHLISSDLLRCRQTAEYVSQATGVTVEYTPSLRERGFGSMEGRPYEEIRAYVSAQSRELGVEPHMVRMEGGESLHDVWERLESVVEKISQKRGPTAVVSHGGAVGLLIAKLIGSAPHTARSFRLANCSITELLRRDDGYWSIERLNDQSHLEEALEGFGAGT